MCHIERIYSLELPKNTILVTMDVSALYTNIPQDEGVECVREVLDERDVQNKLGLSCAKLNSS